MGELILVLLLVCIVSGGIPLLAAGYMRGVLEIPKWFLTVIAILGIALLAFFYSPLRLSSGNPLNNFFALVGYGLAGCFLRKAFTKSKWRFCMLLVFLTNCFGLLIQYLVYKFAMADYEYHLGLLSIGIFLIVGQAVTSFAYFVTPDKELKKTNQKKRRKK